MRKFIKPFDLVVILVVLACSFSVTWLFASNGTQYAVVYVNGAEYGRYNLEETQSRTVEVTTEFGRNVVVIDNKNVWISDTTCKDKVEVNAGKINHSGQSLVCLPNRLVVTIEGRIQTDATAF